ncbi:MAG: HD domain-containing protein, partial [Candidatus Omnitrophica bacterium]|nr:HD domain-containing protein [Candidatus Omnitrophota bacterium]
LGTFFIGITKNATFSLLAWRLSHIGIFFIPIFLFHFIYLLCGLQKRLLLFFAYLQGIIFVSLIISGNYFFVSSIRYIPSFSFFYAVLGPLYHIPFFIWIMLVLYSHYELFRFYLRSPAIKRNQLSYLFFGTLIGFLGGITNFLPAYNIDIYPYGNFTIPIYCLIVTYAIIRYHLMDIEIFIKKTTIITIGVIFPVALLYIGLSYVQPILYPKFGPAWLLIPVILSIAIAAGLFRFVKFILRMNEADLSKKFAYRPMLEKEAERTSKARDVREMATFIVRDVSSFTRLDHTAVFILNEQKNAYSLISSVYRKKDMPKLEEGLMLSLDSPLVAFLKVEKKPAVYGQIMHDLQNKDLTTHERKFLESVESAMAILGTEISVPSFCEDEMVGIMNLGNKITGEIFTGQDLQAFQTLANQTGRAISGLLLKNEKVRLIVSSQKSLLETLEARDHYTRGHTERVSQYCQILGRKLERMIHTIPNSLSALNWTAQLHDLGKVGISDTILLKPAPLNDEEFAKIKEHPTRGIEILGPLKEWFGDDIIQGVVHHHENYDGTGYPDKQKGEQIHVFARIIRVADAFDAMTTDRPYRKGLTLEQAIAEIKKFRKIQFDPIVADGFL